MPHRPRHPTELDTRKAYLTFRWASARQRLTRDQLTWDELMKPTVGLPGERYGRLVIKGEAAPHIPPRGHKKRRVECECDCGKSCVVKVERLRQGHTRSCGCLAREAVVSRCTKHGCSVGRGEGRKLFWVWASMLARCADKEQPSYGGRGITVCAAWDNHDGNGFAQFLRDMGPRPADPPGVRRSIWSIERVDNDGPYAPWNCRWALDPEQGRNKRTNVWLNIGGVKMCQQDAARHLGLPVTTLFRRLADNWEGYSLWDGP
jgi:hypothetical protein